MMDLYGTDCVSATTPVLSTLNLIGTNLREVFTTMRRSSSVYRLLAWVLLATLALTVPGLAGRPLPADQRPVQAAGNLPVTTATYLNGSGASVASAVDIAPNNTIVYAGTLTGSNLGATPTALLGGGNGVVLRLNATGTSLVSLTRIGSRVDDMEVNRSDGQIAVIGSFGVAVLSADASSVVWSSIPATGSDSRVAIASDGTVAALVGKTITTFDASGTLIKQWTLGDTSVRDVAIDASSQSVYATGYHQVDTNLKMPFLRSFSYAGVAKWTNWRWSFSEANNVNLKADTEGYRVAMGRDGNLYFAGETDGGNNVYTRDPRNLSTSAPNVGYDKYNQTSGISGSFRFSYYARLDPATGDLLLGQYVLARLSSGNGNTIRARSIAADETGRVYVGGVSAASIADRDNNQIAGIDVGPYGGSDAFLLVVSPNFQTREVWTPLAGPAPNGGKGTVTAVAAASGIRALGATSTEGSFITHNALLAAPGRTVSDTNTVGYLAAWGGTSANTPPTTSGINNVTVLEDAANSTITLTTAFDDNEDGPTGLTYSVPTNTNAALFTAVNVAGGTLTLDYAPDANGSAALTVRATDSGGLFVDTTFTVTVTQVNDSPTFTAGPDRLVSAGSGPVTNPGWASGFVPGPANESSQGVLEYQVTVTSNDTIFTALPTIDANGTLSFTPVNSIAAPTTADIEVRVRDNGGTANGGSDTSTVQRFSITVTNIDNTPPTTSGIADVSAAADGPDTIIDLLTVFDDAEEGAAGLVYSIESNSNPSLFTNADSLVVGSTLTLDYAPTASGEATIKVRATDGSGGLVEATFTVTVDPADTLTRLYLPLIGLGLAAPQQPDLVGTLAIQPDQDTFTVGEPVVFTVTITNNGTAPTTTGFWVDLFINPTTPPTPDLLPLRWAQTCAEPDYCFGVAWGVDEVLQPGQSIILTSEATSYNEEFTRWPGWLASGPTDLYLYVDNWGEQAPGAILELDETNNRAEILGLTVSGENPPLPQALAPVLLERQRPAHILLSDG